MTEMLKLNDKIGILDAGQLGQKLACATHRRGFTPIGWSQKPDDPIRRAVPNCVHGGWDDKSAIERFVAQDVKRVMCGFENVPAATVERLGELGVEVFDLARLLRCCQDRKLEKEALAATGCKTTDWFCLPDDWKGDTTGLPNYDEVFVKTRSHGFDGRGQKQARGWSEIWTAFRELRKEHPGCQIIVEKKVNFAFEGSVYIARGPDGNYQLSPMFRNEHREGILRRTYWHKDLVEADVQRRVQEHVLQFAAEFNIVGGTTIEFFVLDDGTVIANEVAPRIHNSGHGTRVASTVDHCLQFVQAVAGLQITPMRYHGPWGMINLLGDDMHHADELEAVGWNCELYGKESRPSRKVGDAAQMCDSADDLHNKMMEAERILGAAEAA